MIIEQFAARERKKAARPGEHHIIRFTNDIMMKYMLCAPKAGFACFTLDNIP
jgi:hypothetical protein